MSAGRSQTLWLRSVEMDMDWDMEIDAHVAAAAFGASSAQKNTSVLGGRRCDLNLVFDTNVMLLIGRAFGGTNACATSASMQQESHSMMNGQALMQAIEAHGAARIVVPWTVLCELEGLKSNPDVARDAQNANKALLDLFAGYRDLIIGQTPAEARKAAVDFSELLHPSSSSSPDARGNDNRILQAALQQRDLMKGANVLLVSNDVNLRAKAAVVGIDCADADTFTSKVLLGGMMNGAVHRHTRGDAALPVFEDPPSLKTTKSGIGIDDCIDLASTALSEAIKAKFMQDFGNCWESIVGIDKAFSRWTRTDVLYLAKKHWVGILEESLSSRARDSVDALSELERARRQDTSASNRDPKQIHIDAAIGASQQLLDELVNLLQQRALPFSSEATGVITAAASAFAAHLKSDGASGGANLPHSSTDELGDCEMDVD